MRSADAATSLIEGVRCRGPKCDRLGVPDVDGCYPKDWMMVQHPRASYTDRPNRDQPVSWFCSWKCLREYAWMTERKLQQLRLAADQQRSLQLTRDRAAERRRAVEYVQKGQ